MARMEGARAKTIIIDGERGENTKSEIWQEGDGVSGASSARFWEIDGG